MIVLFNLFFGWAWIGVHWLYVCQLSHFPLLPYEANVHI